MSTSRALEKLVRYPNEIPKEPRHVLILTSSLGWQMGLYADGKWQLSSTPCTPTILCWINLPPPESIPQFCSKRKGHYTGLAIIHRALVDAFGEKNIRKANVSKLVSRGEHSIVKWFDSIRSILTRFDVQFAASENHRENLQSIS